MHLFQKNLRNCKICAIFAADFVSKAQKRNGNNHLKITIIMSEIESKVKAIIVEKLGVDENQVTNQASFTADLGADSLDTVELIMEIEKVFNISIPDEDTQKISTVGDAVAYVEKAVA